MEHWRGVMDRVMEKRKDAYERLAHIDKDGIRERITVWKQTDNELIPLHFKLDTEVFPAFYNGILGRGKAIKIEFQEPVNFSSKDTLIMEINYEPD